MYVSDLKHSSQSLEDKLNQLYTLSGKKNLALDLFRQPFIQLLEAFDNPHQKLPPVIHVAGTNGKGSVIATLRSIYEAAGYKVHVYTSPHLIRFNERIVLAGEQIDDQSLEALIDETLEKNQGRDATFFEATTAMAFAAFARTPADICLLEVGLGGRLDCTNIIETPALTIINTIGMDHMDMLGNSIEKIATEKAGIMKKNVPCVIGHQNYKDVHSVFEAKAKDVGTKYIHAHTDRSVCFPISLLGKHQEKNIQTAITAIKGLQPKFPVSESAIKAGLKSINWPARLQPLPSGKFDLPEHAQLWLEGGHNEDAAKVTANFLATQDGPTDLILCMMKHKDPANFIKPLLPYLRSITCTQIPNEPASLTAKALKAEIESVCPDKEIQIAETYTQALKKIPDPQNILIAGSLYLAGEVLRDLENRS